MKLLSLVEEFQNGSSILSRKPYLAFVLEDIDRPSDEDVQYILLEIEKLAHKIDFQS